MSRAIKFRNSTYLDSNSIVYNRKTLLNILNIYTYNLPDTEYIANGIYYYRIGKIVIVPIDEWNVIKDFVNANILITGFPKANRYTRFLIYNRDSGKNARLAVNGKGEIISHYSSATAAKDWYGLLVYKTNDAY